MRNPYDAIGRIGLLLAIVGAVNWLLVGLFEWNLVKWIFTQSATQTVDNLGERIVYIVVGVGGVLAIPMLAATLARARGRDVRSDESYDRDRTDYDRDRREVAEDDASFYYGAPKEVRSEDQRDVAAASAESRPAEQSGPVRKTERVIIRTEEPIVAPTGSASDSSVSTTSDSGEPSLSADERLRRGSVEEADDEYDERRRAA